MGSCSAVLTHKYVRCDPMIGFARSVAESNRRLLTTAMRLRYSTRTSSAISVRNVFVVERSVMNAGIRAASDALTLDFRLAAAVVTFLDVDDFRYLV